MSIVARVILTHSDINIQ